ncbi:MAG: MMPL family transporter [Aeromicrobium sp.]|uniref:MMPL family transporter n=1 Tax=Aeromicrobium sp. TaxID=1871063 RepID=UPI0026110A00|nr:MMPL family transporter [Aeromicrobium sp.]MDF1706176.1 MMPL family transporter [Aeromicrobium sp.]
MIDALSRLTTSRPWRVLAVTGVFVAVAVVLGGPVTGLLNADTDSFSDTSSDSSLVLDRVAEASGLNASPSVVALVDTGDTRAQGELLDVLDRDDAVGQVVGGPEAGPPFVSDDGTRTFYAVTYTADADVDLATEHLRDELARIDGVSVGGAAVAFQQVNDQVEHDLVRAELLAFPLLFVAALLVFRSAVAALLPLLVGGLTIISSMLVLRGVNEGLEMSVFALNLITGLGLGLAIDYSLFMVSRFREELVRVGPGAEAVRRTVATAGRTVLYSAVTIAGAGVSLLVFPLRFLYSMGVGVILVALMAAAVSLIVLPAIFAVLQLRVNALAPARWRRAGEAEADPDYRGFWYRLSQFVMRYRIATAVVATTVLLGIGAPFLNVSFTGVDSSVLPDSASARVVDDTLRTEFTDADSSPVLVAVTADEDDGQAVTAWAEQLAGLAGVETVVPPRYLGDDLWQLDVITTGAPLDQATKSLVTDIRALDAPGEVLVGGTAADHVDQLATIADRIPLALLILGLLTFVTLFLMTGSVVLPVKALLMNLLTVSATFGLLVMIFQWGHLEGLLDFSSVGALNSTQPVLIFALVFGLSTDYAVFLLTRIKEARDAGASDLEAVALGLQRTGRIVTAAAALFAIALGAFATSEVVFIKQLGIGVAAAVLIDATIVRAFLVPSLMAMLGRRNWWAPRPLRRLHERIGLSET